MSPRLLACALVLVLATQFGTTATHQVPDSCPVTKANQTSRFVPPSPYPKKTFPGNFWLGTDKLWTSLPKDGAWWGLRGYTTDDPTFRQKLFWWRAGYDWDTDRKPKLMVTGRRLDAPARPLHVDEPNSGTVHLNGSMIVTGVNFPTRGCWEVTGRYSGDELTFVVWLGE